MRAIYITLFAVVALAVTMAAVPQEKLQARHPLKVGDRLSGLVGKRFVVDHGSSYVQERVSGPFKLVRVGVDFVELESDAEVAIIPFSSLLVRLLKPK